MYIFYSRIPHVNLLKLNFNNFKYVNDEVGLPYFIIIVLPKLSYKLTELYNKLKIGSCRGFIIIDLCSIKQVNIITREKE